jgi:hypothetical protein
MNPLSFLCIVLVGIDTVYIRKSTIYDTVGSRKLSLVTQRAAVNCHITHRMSAEHQSCTSCIVRKNGYFSLLTLTLNHEPIAPHKTQERKNMKHLTNPSSSPNQSQLSLQKSFTFPENLMSYACQLLLIEFPDRYLMVFQLLAYPPLLFYSSWLN